MKKVFIYQREVFMDRILEAYEEQKRNDEQWLKGDKYVY